MQIYDSFSIITNLLSQKLIKTIEFPWKNETLFLSLHSENIKEDEL